MTNQELRSVVPNVHKTHHKLYDSEVGLHLSKTALYLINVHKFIIKPASISFNGRHETKLFYPRLKANLLKLLILLP